MATTVEANADALSRLARLEVGGLDAKAARQLVAEILASRTDSEVAGEIYASFRAWVGRILRNSAAGDDLRAWYNVLKSVGAQFRGDLEEWAIRLSVLGELLFERAGMADSTDQDAILSRRHTRAIINELFAAAGGRLARADQRTQLGLEQANLTRVCTMLMDAGLIARIEEGRSVSFALTAAGAARARRKAEASPDAACDQLQEAEWELAWKTQLTKGSAMNEWSRFDQPVDELPLAA